MAIGYDKLSLNHELLLGLTFEEMIGTVTYDRAKPAHPCTLHNAPTWGSLASGLPYLDFNSATPHWLDCPVAATGDLDFTSEAFSQAIWINRDTGVLSHIISRVDVASEGWYWYIDIAGAVLFYTVNAGGSQITTTYVNEIIVGNWYLIGITRSVGSVRIFKNGKDVTYSADTHEDPSSVNEELHIGIARDETSNPFDGKIALPRIWGRQLAEWEMLEIFNIERHWFGV